MVKVKVCGITNEKDALKALDCGAWALGFVFFPKSPRYISPEKAKEIINRLPSSILSVGVFVNAKEEEVRHICQITGIKAVQFHGDESPEYCLKFEGFKVIKAFRISQEFDFGQLQEYRVDNYLFDTYQKNLYGGSGKAFNWDLLKTNEILKPFILSGGLNSDNIQRALKTTKATTVDVSSGVEESPGQKSQSLLQAFFEASETI